MKKFLIALFSLLLALFTFSFVKINTEEFEGIIKYRHNVIPKEKSYDVNYDYSGIGKQSEYYYKDGDYKFVNHDCQFNADLFRSKEQKNYLVLNNSDTVLCLDARVADAEILDYNIKRSADTIINYPCDLITIKMKPIGQDAPISYRRYYFSNQLPINPVHFKNCKGSAYDLIYENAKSLPLKIEMEWPNRVVVWEAYEVSKQKLSTDIFEKQKNWVIRKIN